MTKIQWTDEVWNPIVGCARVSPGCQHCYAERVAHRGLTERHRGLTVAGAHGPRWTGEARFVPEVLGKPLHWRKPRRVFVNSMSDLFHDDITFEQIAAVFGVMAATPHLTYQVLTKRPRRMVEFFAWLDDQSMGWPEIYGGQRRDMVMSPCARLYLSDGLPARESWPWPLPNVWLGVSVEDQQRADERIPVLLECPAAVRFLSVEPLLGPVDLNRPAFNGAHFLSATAGIGWVIVGGESGPGARPCNLGWIRSVVEQCRQAGVPVFVKQVGSCPVGRGIDDVTDQIFADIERASADDAHLVRSGMAVRLHLADRKGGDPSEWPEDLRVQEFPASKGAT